MLFALPLAQHFTPREPGHGVLQELVDAIRHRAPPLLALLFVAAGLEVSTPELPAHTVPMLAMAVGLLLCARLDEAGAVAVAAVLLHKGFNPVVAVAMLSIGPFTRRPLMRAMREKNRFLWLGVVAVVWLFAWKGGLLARAAPVARAVLAGLRVPPLHACPPPRRASFSRCIARAATSPLPHSCSSS